MTLRVRVASSPSELEAVRGDWTLLRDRVGRRTSWSDPDRFAAELRVAPSTTRPHVVTFGGPGAPRALLVGRRSVGVVPSRVGLAARLKPRLARLGIVHGGALTDGSTEAVEAVTSYLVAGLKDGTFDLVGWNHLPLDHELFAPLVALGAKPRLVEPHWVSHVVPGSYDETLARLSGSRRKALRRAERALAEAFGAAPELRVFRTVEDVDPLVRGTAALSARTYQAGLGAGFEDVPLWRELLGAEAAAGRLRGYWLVADGAPLAFAVGSLHGSTYFGDFRGYDPLHAALSPGKVLHFRMLEDLCAAGCACYDYGFGENEYKRTHGDESWDEAVLELYGPGLRAATSRLVDASVEGTYQTLRRSAQRLGLLDALRRRRRRRLQRRNGGVDR